MSVISREDAITSILSRLMETEEPTPSWIFSVIRKCLNDLPSLTSTEPLVHDGFYLCDKKPGACPSWKNYGWEKCMNPYCHRTSRVDHALKLPDANDGWIPCEDRLPKCEQEVLICTKKKVYVSKKTGMEWYEESVITPAIYEDGTMLEVNSIWRWEDIDYAGWDEEEDCGIIPEGWWENRHFNPDEVYNNIVDKKVIAWMPLPKPYEPKEDK